MLLFFVFFLSFFSVSASSDQFAEQKEACVKEICKPRVAYVHLSDSLNVQKVYLNLVGLIKRDDIHGIMLSINSSGGGVAELSVLCDLVKRIKKIKPVISLISGSASSMGYVLTSSSDYIVSHGGSNIGAIGVYKAIEKHQNKKIRNNVIESDVAIELFSAGEFKTHLHPDTPRLTEKEREYEVNSIRAIYTYLLKRVCENRGLEMENHKEWAEGKEFLPAEALEMGLIDEIGTIFEAEKKIKELISKRNPDKAFESDVEYYFCNNE